MRNLKTFALAALAAALFASTASAQVNLNDATRKVRGDYFPHQAAARNYVARSAPAAERTFSYEPAKAPEAAAPAPAAAPQTNRPNQRTYSYEPRSVRTYRAPRNDTPSLLLPKADARRVAPVIHW